eukprot:1321554-Pyramimonas_sp.AAC.1
MSVSSPIREVAFPLAPDRVRDNAVVTVHDRKGTRPLREEEGKVVVRGAGCFFGQADQRAQVEEVVAFVGLVAVAVNQEVLGILALERPCRPGEDVHAQRAQLSPSLEWDAV